MSVFINGIKSSWVNFKRILEGNKIFHYLKIMTVQFTGPCPLTLEILLTMKPNEQPSLIFLGEECGLCKEKVGSHSFTSAAASASLAASSQQRPIASTFGLTYSDIPFSQAKSLTDISRRRKATDASQNAKRVLCGKSKKLTASSGGKSSEDDVANFVFLTNDIVKSCEEYTFPVLTSGQEVLDCVAFGGKTNGLYSVENGLPRTNLSDLLSHVNSIISSATL